jgi:hypothetical protein
MNADQTKQKISFVPQADTSLLHARCLEVRQGRKHLVELLISRKHMQIAAHKQSAGK